MDQIPLAEGDGTLVLVAGDIKIPQIVGVVVVVVVVTPATLEDVAADQLQVEVLQDLSKEEVLPLTSQQGMKGVVSYHLTRLGNKMMGILPLFLQVISD